MPKTKSKEYDLGEVTIRYAILDRLEKLGLTRYDLAHYGGCDAAPSTIYRFLSGDKGAFSDNVEQILEAVGLRLVAADEPPDWALERE